VPLRWSGDCDGGPSLVWFFAKVTLRNALSHDTILTRPERRLVIMPPPPLLGYNNNVRHRGRIFHIQTEDSGIASPRIMTHLFADGGRIVKSTRTDYSEHLEREDMAPVVKNMMKEQHKAMFVALRSGELDDLIGFEEDEPSTLAGKAIRPLAEQFLREVQAGTFGQTSKVPSVNAPGRAVAAAVQETPAVEGFAEVAAQPAALPGNKPYAPSRPASIFSAPPPNAASIFGEVGIDEKSLDDAILSYLAEDETEAPKK